MEAAERKQTFRGEEGPAGGLAGPSALAELELITASHTTIAGLIAREGRTAKVGWLWIGLTFAAVTVFAWALFSVVTWPPTDVQLPAQANVSAPG